MRRIACQFKPAGKEDESVHEVSQEELVKRDTPPRASCWAATTCVCETFLFALVEFRIALLRGLRHLLWVGNVRLLTGCVIVLFLFAYVAFGIALLPHLLETVLEDAVWMVTLPLGCSSQNMATRSLRQGVGLGRRKTRLRPGKGDKLVTSAS